MVNSLYTTQYITNMPNKLHLGDIGEFSVFIDLSVKFLK
jgi:hypothetical protein